ncbi:MAG: hypothetical protein Fur0043_02820 [Anaerolineales bacterium]
MKSHRILAILSILLFPALACSIFVGGPDYPEGRIPISAEAVTSLKQQFEEAVVAGAQSGTVTLEMTEEQLTSFIAYKTVAQQSPLFTDPQVYLREGQMRIYGRVQRGYFIANVLIVLNVNVNESGKPSIEITSADFGPFPVPEGLKQSLAVILTEAYTGSLGPVATGFRLETIAIADGIMTLTGRMK